MLENRINAEINQLVINMGRSLLQYLGQCWPWTELNANHERFVIQELVARQQKCLSRLIDLLDRRDWSIDLGVFSTDYTALHYVALEHVLQQLETSEYSILADIEHCLTFCAADADAEAGHLLGEVLAEEREILAEVKKLRKKRPAALA